MRKSLIFTGKMQAVALALVFVYVCGYGWLWAAEEDSSIAAPASAAESEAAPGGDSAAEAPATPEEETAVPETESISETPQTDFSSGDNKEPDEGETSHEESNSDGKRKDIIKNNNFVINPLGLLIGGVSVGYQRGLADLITLGARVSYLPPLLPIFKAHLVGGDLDLYFWTNHPNNGFFVGPVVQVVKAIPKSGEDELREAIAIIGAVDLGYRWIWNNGFNIGLGGGVGWGVAVAEEDSCPAGAECKDSANGIALRLIFDLGYAF